MSASTVRKGHVNFGIEDNSAPKDNSIGLTQINSGHIQIHLGFLQYHHVYSISVEFPKSYFLDHSFKTILNAAEKSTPNVNCKVVSMKENENFYELNVEFFARKERLLREELTFELGNDEKLLIEFHARVLGPGKGTPLLKNGIKCIGVDSEELSDVSDWQAD